MIKYLGSKRALLPVLLRTLASLAHIRSAIDLFSGTSRVGHAFKNAGIFVTSNDANAYAHTLATCYVQADARKWRARATALIQELGREPPRAGYITETYGLRSRFIHPRNGERIDAIRDKIAQLALEPELEAIALVSLMEAADRVDSTAGVQMAYLKSWAPRAHNDLRLRVPDILDGSGRACLGDAVECAAHLTGDLAYLDPPYNQHAYLGNYHLWETLVRWDAPEVYGVACKRIDCRTRKSSFNSRRRIDESMRRVVRDLDVEHLLVSFNNEGYLDRSQLCEILAARGQVSVLAVPYARYVGAKIGIYNPDGQKVGRVSHTRNLEYIFHVAPRQCARPFGFEPFDPDLDPLTPAGPGSPTQDSVCDAVGDEAAVALTLPQAAR